MRDGTGSEPCGSSVVILDLHRLRISSFQLKQCGSILSIAWAGDNAIAAVCHINPSLSEYIETDVSTGVTTCDLLGYDFTRDIRLDVFAQGCLDGRHDMRLARVRFHAFPLRHESRARRLDRRLCDALRPKQLPANRPHDRLSAAVRERTG